MGKSSPIGATGRASAKAITIRDYKPDARAIDEVDWPGTGRKVGILYLHCVEIQQAYFDARERFEDMRAPADPSDPFFDREYCWQLCFRLLVQPGIREPRRIFQNVDQVRAELDQNEVDFFIEHFQEWQARRYREWGLDEKDPTAQQ